MLLIVSCVLAGLVVLVEITGVVKGCYSFKEERTVDRFRHLLYPGAMFLLIMFRHLVKKYVPWKNQGDRQYYEKLYVGSDYEKVKNDCEAGMVSIGMLVIFLASVVVILVKSSGIYATEQVDSIIRPYRGEEKYGVTALYGDDSFDIELDVNETYPTQAQMIERIEAASNNLEKEILGNNESLENVTTDLVLADYYENAGVEVAWKCSDSRLIHSDGTVENEDLTEARIVLLTATLTCFEETREKSFLITVMPESAESVKKNLLINSLEELLEVTKYEEEVTLPDEFRGEELNFINRKEDNSGLILALGIVVTLLLIPLWYENKRNRLNAREAQMLCDYPDVIGKFVMLLEAGFGIRIAFERVAADYEKRRNERNKRYVYEEMLKTRNEIALGKSEIEAYEAFGRRCGNIFYIRFAALLTQCVKKGGESLVPQLRKEVTESVKERQQAVRKRGEEASIKLLVPMMGMFALVLAIILIPAFLSM